jgi:hypothetical protein
MAAPASSFEDRCRETSITKMRELITDNWKHTHGDTADVKSLTTGVYYPNGYFKLLRKAQACGRLTEKSKASVTARLDWMIKKGAFFHGIVPKTSFSIADDPSCPTGKELMHYRIKAGVLPSKAIKALKIGLTFLGCGEACQLTHYEMLLEILGTDKFNALFAAGSDTPLSMLYNSLDNPLNGICTAHETEVSERELHPGMIVHVKNTQLYAIKHINGEAAGFNVMYLGEGKYLGLGLSPEGVSIEDIRQELITEYNQPNDLDTTIVTDKVARKIFATTNGSVMVGERIMTRLEYRTILKDHTITSFIPERDGEGGTIATRIIDLDYAKVQQLHEASIPEARRLLSSWKARVITL